MMVYKGEEHGFAFQRRMWFVILNLTPLPQSRVGTQIAEVVDLNEPGESFSCCSALPDSDQAFGRFSPTPSLAWLVHFASSHMD